MPLLPSYRLASPSPAHANGIIRLWPPLVSLAGILPSLPVIRHVDIDELHFADPGRDPGAGIFRDGIHVRQVGGDGGLPFLPDPAIQDEVKGGHREL